MDNQTSVDNQTNVDKRELRCKNIATYGNVIFRIVYGWTLLAAALFGFAISSSITMMTSYVVARGAFDAEQYRTQAALWSMFLPLISLTMAVLVDECFDLFVDTVAPSGWSQTTMGGDPVDDRYTTISAVTSGGNRPPMLRFRSMISAILTAAFFHEPNQPKLFCIPVEIRVFVDIIFLFGSLILPVIYMFSGGSFGFAANYITSLKTGLFFICLVLPLLYTMMHLIVFLWPRASILYAFACGEEQAEILWHPHVLNLNDLKVSLRPHRLRCCGICSSSSNMAEEQKESDDELLTLREWDSLTKKNFAVTRNMIDSLRNINKESANTVLFNGSTTHYPGAALIMALPGRWKKQIYRTEPVDSAADNAEAGVLEKKDSPTPENSNSVSNEINQTASNRLQDIRAKHRLRLQNKIGVPPLILTSPTTQTNNNSTSNNNNNYNYEKGSATGGASKFASSSKLNDSDSETNSINSIPSATNMRNQSFQTTAGWTPSNTESLVETKVPAADGVSSKYTMEPLEMDEAAKNEKKNKKKTTREPRDIVGLLYRFYNILINFLNRRGVLPSILVILYVLSVCLGLFVDGAVIGVQIVSSFITIVMGMMLHRVAAPFLGRIFITVVGFQFFFMLNLTLGTYNGVQTTQVQTDPCCWKEARYRANATWPTLATPLQQQNGFPSPSKNYLPICNLAWGLNRVLSVMDVAMLADASYHPYFGKTTVLDAFRNGPLADAILNKTVTQGGMNNGRKSAVTWGRWKFPTAKTIVYTIQGTSTFLDILIDLSWFSIQAGIKTVSHILPMQDLLPTRVLRHLVDVLSNSDFSPEAEIGDILSEVENTKLLYPTTSGWTVLVTGHSLGADIALVLGARAKIPAFGLSPPGLFLGTSKMNIDSVSSTYSFLSAIIPDYDLVPKSDGQVGLIQQIPCTVPQNSFADAAPCHSSTRTFAMLAAACRDVHYPQRRWRISDENGGYFYGEDGNGGDVKLPSDWKN